MSNNNSTKNSNEISVEKLAKLVEGRVIGNKDLIIKGICSPSKPIDSCIVAIYEKKIIKEINVNKFSAILTNKEIENCKSPQIIVDEPRLAISKVLSHFNPHNMPEFKLSDKACIDEDVIFTGEAYVGEFVSIKSGSKIGNETFIYPNCYIGENVEIGDNCIINPNVTIKHNVIIKDNVIIHSGTIIGSDGYAYINYKGVSHKIPQIGSIVIDKNVEIGANCCIDRAMLDETYIGEGTKIDNLVHIAHNVKIGKNCIIVAQVGIAGSCTIGDNCIFGGQVGISDHIKIADGCMIAAQSGVGKDIDEKGKYLFGSPARDFKQMSRIIYSMEKLPELIKRVSNLEDKNNEKK